ncbi:MAG: KilA-N domain-containing protein [Methanomassiliicoccaceae archaeon]|nr:KilA-N domain-containing protein [Methanomassiliicoccaceae archaeon]
MTVRGIDIRYSRVNHNDYISLTDIAQIKNRSAPWEVIKNWLRNKDTIAFLGLWETLNNPNFKVLESEGLGKDATKRPAPPEGPRPVRGTKFGRQCAHACACVLACDNIINCAHPTDEHSQSMQIGIGMGKR